MKIAIFKNKKGLIMGEDPRRMTCDKVGTLTIAGATVDVSPLNDTVMPILINGATGTYRATFSSSEGDEYDLGKVYIKGGRVVNPPEHEIETAELRLRVDMLEDEHSRIMELIRELSEVFDTNSLNFLIK